MPLCHDTAHLAALLVTLLAVAAAMSACSPPASPDTALRGALTLEEPPPDFALAVTVNAPAGAHRNPEVPRWRRPARYIVEADRELRAATGPGVDQETFPRRTRRLTHDQTKSVWRLLRDSGFLDASHPAIVGMVPQRYDELDTRYVVSYTVRGVTRTLVIDADTPTVDAEAASLLVDQLARLAWIPD